MLFVSIAVKFFDPDSMRKELKLYMGTCDYYVISLPNYPEDLNVVQFAVSKYIEDLDIRNQNRKRIAVVFNPDCPKNLTIYLKEQKSCAANLDLESILIYYEDTRVIQESYSKDYLLKHDELSKIVQNARENSWNDADKDSLKYIFKIIPKLKESYAQRIQSSLLKMQKLKQELETQISIALPFEKAWEPEYQNDISPEYYEDSRQIDFLLGF